MAKRKSTPQNVPDAVRDAVQRTVQATVGSVDEALRSAQGTRGRAQEAIDELMKALEDRRPASHEEVRQLRDDVAALAKRLDAVEKRLPKRSPRQTGKRST